MVWSSMRSRDEPGRRSDAFKRSSNRDCILDRVDRDVVVASGRR